MATEPVASLPNAPGLDQPNRWIEVEAAMLEKSARFNDAFIVGNDIIHSVAKHTNRIWVLACHGLRDLQSWINKAEISHQLREIQIVDLVSRVEVVKLAVANFGDIGSSEYFQQSHPNIVAKNR